MSNAGTAINPGNALGPNEYVRARRRPDQSTIAGAAGSYYGSPEPGNTVDRRRINPTLDRVSRRSTSIYPGGVSTGSGS